MHNQYTTQPTEANFFQNHNTWNGIINKDFTNVHSLKYQNCFIKTDDIAKNSAHNEYTLMQSNRQLDSSYCFNTTQNDHLKMLTNKFSIEPYMNNGTLKNQPIKPIPVYHYGFENTNNKQNYFHQNIRNCNLCQPSSCMQLNPLNTEKTSHYDSNQLIMIDDKTDDRNLALEKAKSSKNEVNAQILEDAFDKCFDIIEIPYEQIVKNKDNLEKFINTYDNNKEINSEKKRKATIVDVNDDDFDDNDDYNKQKMPQKSSNQVVLDSIIASRENIQIAKRRNKAMCTPLYYNIEPLRKSITQMNTRELVEQVKNVLCNYCISQKLFGRALLNSSESSMSLLMSKPRRWIDLSKRGKEPYLRMHLWLNDPDGLRKIKEWIENYRETLKSQHFKTPNAKAKNMPDLNGLAGLIDGCDEIDEISSINAEFNEDGEEINDESDDDVVILNDDND